MKANAFGVQPQVEHVKIPLRMAGQYVDEEVGLFYNYFRFYNPETGRYVENDPIDLQGGLNRYGFVNGNTLHYVDPYGLSTQISIVGGSTGAVALGLGISLGISVPDDMTKINCYQIFGSTNINAMIEYI